MRFDHAIVAVNDLDTAVENYRSLGFTVIYGGEHAAGTTHNALICFQNGSYIELLAPTGKDPKPDSDAVDFSHLLADGEGLVGYALYADKLDKVASTMRERSIEINEPKPGKRQRKDGVQLEWETAMIGNSMCPFFIEDQTERNLRVPDDTETTTHANGALGIVNVTITTHDETESVKKYSAMLGLEPLPEHDDKVFQLDDCRITIIQPRDADKEKLHRIVIHTTQKDYPILPLEKTHQANVVLFPEA